jgi:hypothetical protein
MTAQQDPELKRIQNEIYNNHLKIEETWTELRDKVRTGASTLSKDPKFVKKALILSTAMVVLGLFLFYDRGSNS